MTGGNYEQIQSKSIINNLARLVRGSSQSTQPNTLRPLGRPVGESDSGRLASRLANRRSSQSPQQSPHIFKRPPDTCR